MASLKVVRGTLIYQSEYKLPKPGQYTLWPLWRIEAEDGRDVVLQNVRARETMLSHAIAGTEATFVFTADLSPILIGMRYPEGHTASGWDEWKEDRMKAVYFFWFGVVLLLPLPMFYYLDWSRDVGLWALVAAIFGLLSLGAGLLGLLGNLISSKPTKSDVASALAEAA